MILQSLLFGFAAWTLAAVSLKRSKKLPFLVTGSFACSFASAIWQFFEIRKRAQSGDFAGILDTIDAIIFGLLIMMGITLLLNTLALKGTKNKR